MFKLPTITRCNRSLRYTPALCVQPDVYRLALHLNIQSQQPHSWLRIGWCAFAASAVTCGTINKLWWEMCVQKLTNGGKTKKTALPFLQMENNWLWEPASGEKFFLSILVTAEYHWQRRDIIACTCSDNSEVCVKWCELLFVYVWICCQ